MVPLLMATTNTLILTRPSWPQHLPILHLPHRLLTLLLDVDELLTQWRVRHSLMVHR